VAVAPARAGTAQQADEATGRTAASNRCTLSVRIPLGGAPMVGLMPDVAQRPTFRRH
jgi:hypothetical protein